MKVLPGDVSRTGVVALAELTERELSKFKRDIIEISISSTAAIRDAPAQGKPGLFSVSIRVDDEVDGDLLRASLKDGLLHFWGWSEKFELM